MDTIKTALEPMKGIPNDFWYALSMLLVGVLIWIIQKYFASVTETMKSMGESIKKLTDMVNLHDYQIKELQNKGGLRRKA